MTDRAGWAVCAIAPGGVEVGVDLELVEERTPLFVHDYFTPQEAARAGHGADPMMSNLIWSAKESALKVLRTGLRRDTRSVEVAVEDATNDGWGRLSVTGDGIVSPFTGWWQRYGLFVLTIVADAATAPPASLDSSPGLAGAEPVHSWLSAPGPIG
jgi:4'-phosphopantetheinyl transferase